MSNKVVGGTSEQRQALRDLVQLGWGGAIVEVCSSLQIDGGWLETFVLREMMDSEHSHSGQWAVDL